MSLFFNVQNVKNEAIGGGARCSDGAGLEHISRGKKNASEGRESTGGTAPLAGLTARHGCQAEYHGRDGGADGGAPPALAKVP